MQEGRGTESCEETTLEQNYDDNNYHQRVRTHIYDKLVKLACRIYRRLSVINLMFFFHSFHWTAAGMEQRQA